MTMPAVSVVMPVYNEAPFVEAAVQSVLAQTVRDLELVIVDNGSTDASPEILGRITDPRVRIFRNPHNLGSAAASNRLVRESRAPLIARMDADDVALSDRLEKQLAAFAAQPTLALLGGQVRHVEGGALLLRRFAPRALTRGGIAWQALFSSPFFHSTAMFTRASFEAAGGYDERMQRSSDFALFSRMQANGHAANLPDVLVQFRRAPRALLLDGDYERLVRNVIEENTRHALQPSSANPRLRQLIDEWPDVALMLRSAETSPRLPELLSAFIERFRELQNDPAADREIARDAGFVLCSNAWLAMLLRRPGAMRLVRASFAHAPLLASELFAREVAQGAVRRMRRRR
jgi:glycosyltransferase involved in cell wall biosynthesis